MYLLLVTKDGSPTPPQISPLSSNHTPTFSRNNHIIGVPNEVHSPTKYSPFTMLDYQSTDLSLLSLPNNENGVMDTFPSFEGEEGYSTHE
jgi:hypothetical protein